VADPRPHTRSTSSRSRVPIANPVGAPRSVASQSSPRSSVMSALRDPATGFCPEPGAGDYRVADVNSNLANMLQPGDECIQLTIEDNGPYDNDPTAGVVADPGGVGLTTAALPKPEAKTSDGGGCSISVTGVNPLQRSEWGLLGGLVALLGLSGYRRRRRKD